MMNLFMTGKLLKMTLKNTGLLSMALAMALARTVYSRVSV